MAHIWYRKDDFFGTIAEKLNAEEYHYVGSVKENRVADVFRAMNHVDDSEVETQLKAFGVRSMSVGDIVVNEEGVWLCEHVGWKNIQDDPAAKRFLLTLMGCQ